MPTGVVEPFAERANREQISLRRHRLTELQVNLGKLCNQTCTHCHVDAGPTKRRENMDRATAERVVELALATPSLQSVDLTGGAPELNPNFRWIVERLSEQNVAVIDRCNLTVLSEPGQETTAEFLARHHIRVVASLPCYLSENVDQQRGRGVFERSIRGIQQLNRLGYGQPGSGLRLDLVFNPTSPSLPPDQQQLEAAYKRELAARYDIHFDRLLTITNMPIRRYGVQLQRSGRLQPYLKLLADHFNPRAAEQVMCRSLVSIGWDGQIYDCDFNQMLQMPAGGAEPTTVWDVESLGHWIDRPIAIADHCYGCTAGSGSSCSGAVV